jgi:hypothetical protein
VRESEARGTGRGSLDRRPSTVDPTLNDQNIPSILRESNRRRAAAFWRLRDFASDKRTLSFACNEELEPPVGHLTNT